MGPIVTATASAKTFTPFNISALTSPPNLERMEISKMIQKLLKPRKPVYLTSLAYPLDERAAR